MPQTHPRTGRGTPRSAEPRPPRPTTCWPLAAAKSATSARRAIATVIGTHAFTEHRPARNHVSPDALVSARSCSRTKPTAHFLSLVGADAHAGVERHVDQPILGTQLGKTREECLALIATMRTKGREQQGAASATERRRRRFLRNPGRGSPGQLDGFLATWGAAIFLRGRLRGTRSLPVLVEDSPANNLELHLTHTCMSERAASCCRSVHLQFGITTMFHPSWCSMRAMSAAYCSSSPDVLSRHHRRH